MTPQPAKGHAVNETYELLRRAAARRQSVAAIYDGLPRLFCPHVLGRKAGRFHALVYQIGGEQQWTAGGVLRSRRLALLERGET
jgi:hypothetical protein